MWITNLEAGKDVQKKEVRFTYSLNRRLSEKIYCRDPYVMPCGGKYYHYFSGGKDGIFCSVSDDLELWSDPLCVFAPPADFHGTKDFFWAPECHFYKGKYYVFTSVYSKDNNHRSISVYRADDPLGPFEDICRGHVSPFDWDAIDGTLYVDGEGDPWMVFVHEWTCMPDGNGAMAAARLSDDMTHFISEPVQLFLARDLKYAVAGVTDGPFLYRSDGGNLFMIWSNFSEKGYVIACAKSSTGKITGPWIQSDVPLYEKDRKPGWIYDGGHPMIFRRNDGKFMLSFHCPNAKSVTAYEHVTFEEITLGEEGIKI